MKIPYLLAQYLYKQKQLDLPGIGSFILDPSVIPDANANNQQPGISEGISFRSNPLNAESKELVTYISAETGKMRPLAAADLDSYIQSALQFLNIGKPFTFEGIGTLTKLRPFEYEFTPGVLIPEKMKETGVKDKQPLSPKDSVDMKYQTYLSEPETKAKWKRPVVALLIICGIGITIWAGYSISTRNSNNEDFVEDISQVQGASLVTDSIPAVDSTVIKSQQKKEDSYKYILEVAQSKRAFKRYNQLRTNLWAVQLETEDSVKYKLVLRLPATPDTTRVLDSLMVMLGRPVYIEHVN